jgi:NADH dehydrogenase
LPIQTHSHTVAVTGSTGFVGRHVVRALVERGHCVRALVRDPARARVLPTAGVTRVLGDVLDPAAMRDLCDGAATMVHLIGIRAERPGGVTFQRMHIGATRAALDAASAGGLRRFIHMSALGTRPDARSAYHRTKFAAEQMVRASDLDWTIFRPSIIHGPEGEFMQLAKGWVTGRKPPFLFLPYFTPFDGPRPLSPAKVQPVHVDDVAALFADALANDASIGEVYPVGGPDELTWPDLLRAVRDVMPGAKRSLEPQGLPAPICRMNARAARALGLAGLLPFREGDVIMATEPSVCDLAKARAHFLFAPRPFARSVGEYAAQV